MKESNGTFVHAHEGKPQKKIVFFRFSFLSVLSDCQHVYRRWVDDIFKLQGMDIFEEKSKINLDFKNSTNFKISTNFKF